MVCSFSDVTSEREAEAALSYQATHDPLTRLPNRVSLLSHLRNQVEPGIGQLAVLFIDLDRFKLVNDSVGHMDADQVLRIVASRLLGACRGSEFVGRLAGDEFVVVLRDFENPDDAHGFAERLADRVSEPIVLDSGREVLVTASIGVAVASPGGEDLDVEDLVQRSDAAMYQAKQAGRNRVERYHRALHEKALHRMMLRERLQEAINDDVLGVAYQPVVDLATGTVLGFEALARWTLDAEGPVPPSVFVPIAEEDGLIVDLGKQVLRRACTDFARWRAGRPDAHDLTLAVNISTRQLGSELLIDTVVESLQLSGLAGRDLWLEVTESVLAAHEPTARRVLDGLRSLGVRLAVDDFGTGHSSLLSPAALPRRDAQDRSVVRRGPRARHRLRGHRGRGGRPRQLAGALGRGRGRRDRGPAPTASPRWAARSARATCSAGRARSTACRATADHPHLGPGRPRRRPCSGASPTVHPASWLPSPNRHPDAP